MQPIDLPVVDRASVRAFAASETEYFASVSAAGQSVAHATLDRQDAIQAFMKTLADGDVVKFALLYSEEMEVAGEARTSQAQAVLDEATRELNATTATLDAAKADAAMIDRSQIESIENASQIIQIIIFFAALIAVIAVWKKLGAL